MKKRKKKVTKNRKKFFIIAGCYIAVFIITCLTTVATLAWFNGGTFAKNTLYLGGPVYLYFGDTDDNNVENNLVLKTPVGWNYLYPGMNIQLQARAILQGAKFENTVPETGEQTIVYSTGAILRARVMIRIFPPEDVNYSPELLAKITNDIYQNIWLQVKAKAVNNVDSRNEGVWVLDNDYNYSDSELEEDHFFYYVEPGQNGVEDSGKYQLLEVGGTEENVSVGFLDQAVITLSGKELTNDHADCQIQFTIIFHALQAFLPYTYDEIDDTYTGSDPNHGSIVLPSDVGTPKDLTIENSRFYFADAFDDIYDKPTDII